MMLFVPVRLQVQGGFFFLPNPAVLAGPMSRFGERVEEVHHRQHGQDSQVEFPDEAALGKGIDGEGGGGMVWGSSGAAEMMGELARCFSFWEDGSLELVGVVGLISEAMVMAMWGIVLFG